MTKRWVMDAKARTVERYDAVHKAIAWEVKMSRHIRPVQKPLFATVEQPRNVKPEPAALYAAVVALRKHGRCVYRAGRHEHIVDGHTVGDVQLAAMARQIAGPA